MGSALLDQGAPSQPAAPSRCTAGPGADSPKTPSEAPDVPNILQHVLCKLESGITVDFQKWIPELEKPDPMAHGLYAAVKDWIAGACSFCAGAFGVKDKVMACGVKPAGDRGSSELQENRVAGVSDHYVLIAPLFGHAMNKGGVRRPCLHTSSASTPEARSSSINNDTIRRLEQLHHLQQGNGRRCPGYSCRINLIEQHHGLIPVDFNAQLVLEKVEVLTVIAWDLLQWHAHLF